MNSEISVGALVINPARPEWGPGKVIKLEAQRAYVIWRNVLDQQPKTMIPSALILAKVQRDPYLESVFEKTVRRNSRPRRERTSSDQIQRPILRRDFVGFTEADFVELAGSAWRGRHSLGGLLAATLRGTLKRPYRSWGVKRRLELHIANENHYSSSDPFPFPKLFVYSQDRLTFGFYMEAPLNLSHPAAAKHTYWRSFRKQLIENRNVSEILLRAMEKHKLILADYYRRDRGVFRGSFTVRDGAIIFESSIDKHVDNMTNDEFIHRITKPKSREWMDLHVFTEIDKAAAIGLKGEVATPILHVLKDLSPLYECSLLLPDQN
jgi:hypothetical protein